ncbi:hypothetical protein NBRC111893_2460 [Lentilactobacillus kosonis]|uniref:Uncharacterized protein n=1 Tax=Lentilactobacillus kosonis TaxID=2810561 RepID=A0A401FPM4_9LACO|nr:hypothetical protein NBRC111893_2460 [Lentilactobacillus kosonis]
MKEIIWNYFSTGLGYLILMWIGYIIFGMILHPRDWFN